MESKKGKAFFDRASLAVEEVKRAREKLDQDLGAADLRREWVWLLAELRKSLKFLEQAARNLGHNKWADSFVRERKENSAVNYLFHARNADSYTVEPGHEESSASLVIGEALKFGGSFNNLTLMNVTMECVLPDGRRVEAPVNGNFRTEDGKITSGFLNTSVPIKRERAYLRVKPVYDRGKEYCPPNLRCREQHMAPVLAHICEAWIIGKKEELENLTKN